MEAEKEEKKRKISIRLFLLAIVVIIVLIEVIIVIVTRGDGSDEYGGQHEDYAGPFVSFDNFEYLREMADGLPIGFTERLQELILEEADETISDDPEDIVIYSVKVDNSSLTTEVYFPWNICNFKISVSDGRQYDINLAINGGKMGGFTLKRTDIEQSAVDLYLFNTDEDTDNYETERLAIKKWAEEHAIK